MKYKAVVSYDGTSFSGWQIQTGKRTVQGCIEEALETITRQQITIFGSGRTDAKVHAYGQVFHFESEKELSGREWKNAFFALLPKDIYVKEVVEVVDEFHARYHVKEKTYQYLINSGEYNPLAINYQLQFNRYLNIDLMQQAASYLMGTHDFTSFNANTLVERPNQVRTISVLEIMEEAGNITLRFTGDGFLRYMVRMLVATLIRVGAGKIKPEEVKNMLELKDKQVCPYNVDACGLYLVEVTYQEVF